MKLSMRVLCIGLIVFLESFLVSCTNNADVGNQANIDNNTETITTIHLMTSWGGVDSKAGTLNNIIKVFEEQNPNYKIANESIFGDDYLPALKTRISSGNDPDVFGLWPGSDIKSLIKAKKVADLTDILKNDREWMDSFNQDSFTYTTENERIYGIPFELVFEGLFINRDLFNKYHIKVPQNFDDLITAIKIFKQNNITPIAYNSSAEGSYLYQNIIASIGGKKGVEEYIINGKINECYIDAMKYIKQLYSLGAFPNDAMTLNSNERNELFISKKAAMIVQGSWFIPYFDKSDTSVEFIPFPSIKDNRRVIPSGLGNGTFYISSNAWNNSSLKDGSVIFLKYITSKDSVSYFYNNSELMSNTNYTLDTKFSNLATQSMNMFKSTKQENITPIPDHIIDRTAWEDIVVRQFPYYLEGNVTPENIWDSALQKILNN
jgi:raffinose/stachyose/melibiose transport system substrate-binding protein